MIVNDRDALLQQPGPRFSIVGSGIFLSGSSSTVRTAADGSAPNPASITLTATLLGVTGTPVWSITGGTLAGIGDTTRTLAASGMTSEVAVVSVKLTYAGVTYNASYSIAKVRDGSSGQGAPGARGAGHYYAQGLEWNNDKASAACPGGPRLNDVVTISSSSGTFALTKGWDGDSWEPLGQIFDGSLFVTQSISAGAIDARGLSIKDAQGNVILQAGQPLAESAVPASAQNSQLTPIIQAAATTADWSKVSSRPSDESIKNNLIDLSWWTRLGNSPWATNGEFNVLGNSLSDYGVYGPKGVAEDVWYMKEVNNTGTIGADNPSGGWNDAPLNLDPTKTYRFVVPVMRISGVGTAWWGIRNVATLNTTAPADGNNPYFVGGFNAPLGRWFLLVGYIFPAGSTGRNNSGAGAIDCATGQWVSGVGTNWNFLPGQGNIVHRAYQYYASNGAEQMFGRPMVNVVDGTEPSLREYLAPSALFNSSISLSESGALVGAGGGQVTLHGMGQNTFRIFTSGNTASNRPAFGLGFYINGSLYAGVGRSYNLIAIRRSDLAVAHNKQYDVYGNGEINGLGSSWLATDLNWFADRPGQYIIVLYSSDEPANRRLDSGLPAAIYRNGGSRAVFGSANFKQWSAYSLVGISGCGEGGGAEAYQGDIDADPNAWIDVTFTMNNGDLASVSNNFTPRTLKDYGYVGDLNATAGATLGANVSGSINDSNAAGLVTVTSLRVVSSKIGSYSTPGAGGRTDLNDSGMRVYDGNGALRVRIGNLAN